MYTAKENRFMCGVCGQAFNVNGELKTHKEGYRNSFVEESVDEMKCG